MSEFDQPTHLEALAGNLAFLSTEDMQKLAKMLVTEYHHTATQLDFFISVEFQEQ